MYYKNDRKIVDRQPSQYYKGKSKNYENYRREKRELVRLIFK